MEIVNFSTLNDTQRLQAAQMLTDEISEGWESLSDAMTEIQECEENPDYMLFAAVEDDVVIGWIGLEPQHNKAFELHPLVVRNDMQGKGVGTMLLKLVEETAKAKGGLVLKLSASDENYGGETSLANVNLYEDLYEKLANFKPGTHQARFYLKNGYTLTGVVPDAYGIGKPDILMAKRL